MNRARELWVGFETVHAITYFAPGCVEANRAVGLRGFWMGYFASRSVPMGTPSAAEIVDVFFSFRPSMVERAIPDAWLFADREAVLEARVASAAQVLRSLREGLDETALAIVEPIEAVASDSHVVGPLAGPNRDLPIRDDPVERLWQACTTLREHRGDAHIDALRAAQLGPIDSLVLFSASGGAPRGSLQPARGWSDEEWDKASASLTDRGLVTSDGLITSAGRTVRSLVEVATDRGALEPWAAITAEERARVGAVLADISSTIAESDLLPYSNPIGLPRPIGP